MSQKPSLAGRLPRAKRGDCSHASDRSESSLFGCGLVPRAEIVALPGSWLAGGQSAACAAIEHLIRLPTHAGAIRGLTGLTRWRGRDVERRVAVRLARRKRQLKNIARDQSEPHLRSKLVRSSDPKRWDIAMEDVERRVIGKLMRRLIPFLVLCTRSLPGSRQRKLRKAPHESGAWFQRGGLRPRRRALLHRLFPV